VPTAYPTIDLLQRAVDLFEVLHLRDGKAATRIRTSVELRAA